MAKVLVALWVIVAVYWAWSRRPATGEAGVSRRELRVVQRSAHVRVLPGARRGTGGTAFLAWYSAVYASAPSTHAGSAVADQERRPGSGGSGSSLVPVVPARPVVPAPRAGAGLDSKRAEVRRRRRSVLMVLLALVVTSLLAVVLTRSVVAIAFQMTSDTTLLAYGYVLSRVAARVGRPAGAGSPSAQEPARRVRGPRQEVEPARAVAMRPTLLPALDEASSPRRRRAGYAPAHTLAQARSGLTAGWRAPGAEERDEGASYGDFESYASLALA